MRAATPFPLAIAALLATALAGCGKALPSSTSAPPGGAVTRVAGASAVAVSGLATKNTTRFAGANPVVDAAAVALAVDPGLTPATRPAAVVLVNWRDWPAALVAAELASSPLRAPLLYSDGDALPAISAQALTAMKPRGARPLGGAQVLAIGTAAAPRDYRVRALGGGSASERAPTPGSPAARIGASSAQTAGALARDAALAARVERLGEILHGGAPHRVIVVGADGPAALAMPAAGLAAESGAPILLVDRAGVPRATRSVLARLRHPAIYAIGPPAAVSSATLAKLARFGAVTRIAATAPAAGGASTGTSSSSTATGSSPTGAGGAEDPVSNAIAVARFSDGPFGWGIDEPGHGLVFANASRPLDAPAAAPLSASGDYGPLLLLDGPGAVPAPLARYLGDIQPAYADTPEYAPVRGVYNHGWLIGDERAIAATTQAELDGLLEISPQGTANAQSSQPTTSFRNTHSSPSSPPSP